MATTPKAGMGFFRLSKEGVLLSIPSEETGDPYVYDPETIVWMGRVEAAGGGFLSGSKLIADLLIREIKTRSYNSKLIWLLPLLGSNLAAARVPLRDTLAVGIAPNSGFNEADFTERLGLQGNGAKYLNSLIKPSALSPTTLNGGLGWWENNVDISGVGPQPIGMESTTNRYVIDLRSGFYAFSWGSWVTTNASVGVPATNGHYYGQRVNSTLRQLVKNGSVVASNTVADSAVGSGDKTMLICGSDQAGGIFPWPGRCAVAYMTDGTLTAVELSDFHSLLNLKLMNAVHRPS